MGEVATPGGQDWGFLPVPRYRRVVVKLSGEALAGSGSSGVDPASLSRVAEEVLSVHDLGVQVAVVVGGGNYFRGRLAEGWGISRAEADNIGMLGTIMNALMLRGTLTARTDTDIRVMTAVPIHSVAEPFIRLRAPPHLNRGLIVLFAGGIGQPYVTTDYPAVQRALELDADALLVAKRGVDRVLRQRPARQPGRAALYDADLRRGAGHRGPDDGHQRVRPGQRAVPDHARVRCRRGGRDARDLRRRRARHPDQRQVAGRGVRRACPFGVRPGRPRRRRPGAGTALTGRRRSWAWVHCWVAAKTSLV